MNAIDKFQKRMQELLVEYYKQAISDNIKRGIEAKKRRKANQNDRHN